MSIEIKLEEQLLSNLEAFKSNYKELKDGRKFQILTSILGDVNNIYVNEFHSNGYSIVDKHSEMKAIMENEGKNELVGTHPPCDVCYEEIINHFQNDFKYYYLCDEYNENKKSIANPNVIWIGSMISKGDFEHYKTILNDYLRYKRKNVDKSS